MATHSQCQPRPHPFLPHRHPTSPLGGGVTGRSASQRAAAATTRRCLPPTTTTTSSPPPSICAQVAANTASDTCHLSTHFPEVRPLRETLFFPLTGNIFHFSPEPKRLSVPRLRVSRPESQKNQRKTNRRVGGGGIEEPSFCHLDNLVCKPFGMSLLQQVYSG